MMVVRFQGQMNQISGIGQNNLPVFLISVLIDSVIKTIKNIVNRMVIGHMLQIVYSIAYVIFQ